VILTLCGIGGAINRTFELPKQHNSKHTVPSTRLAATAASAGFTPIGTLANI